MKNKIGTMAVVLSFGIIILMCLISVFNKEYLEHKAQNDFKRLESAVTEVTASTVPIGTKLTTKTTINKTEEQKGVAEVSNYQPHSSAKLQSINPDSIGWIKISGANINYPVMHTPDEPEKYLNKNYYGEYSQSGVPFLDFRCNTDSVNLIIYGHNMNNGTMFADLCKYTDYSYFESHSTVILETKEGTVQYNIFAVMKVKPDDNWYRFITADIQKDYDKQIKDAKKNSLYKTEVVPEYDKQILTLSTCYGNDERILVLAVKNQEVK